MCEIPKGFPECEIPQGFLYGMEFNKIIIFPAGKSRRDSLKCGESLVKIPHRG